MRTVTSLRAPAEVEDGDAAGMEGRSCARVVFFIKLRDWNNICGNK